MKGFRKPAATTMPISNSIPTFVILQDPWITPRVVKCGGAVPYRKCTQETNPRNPQDCSTSCNVYTDEDISGPSNICLYTCKGLLAKSVAQVSWITTGYVRSYCSREQIINQEMKLFHAYYRVLNSILDETYHRGFQGNSGMELMAHDMLTRKT
ncbi:hypothetical protein M430DRAFT_15777 [Amorphotheca resinae ATCC 22711]|jgi:hypothetical protein|uniref:Uncharacterized protein n=1 Tax=Amorphotheca resinae ATCC 22711 TaxID=857342 RepID=A0A2T3B9R9_AMORE|nr:hypothetical protein M430DRAFT_15777 [Amorphotheca resinae ATCC 22711]PSS25029.1 hypothetical protein M430DRAFT_15777 [Amorphotheca resinae ATCC 22711]